MKAPYLSVFVFFINFLSFGWPCSEEELGVIDNALLKCSTNESCEAQCYRGYVFPNGETRIIYSCKDGVWNPMTSACKKRLSIFIMLMIVIPVLHIEYDAIWSFQNVIPKACTNITIRLNSSKNTLEEAFLEQCEVLIDNYTVQFTYMVLAFQVTTIFSTEYTNYTSLKAVNTCSSYLEIVFQNKTISTIFDEITCENETANYKLFRSLAIRDQYIECSQGMKIKNISGNLSVSEISGQYCDYEDATPVTNSVTKINEGTTTDLRFISDTTVTILRNSIRTTPSNDITAISTTVFSGDERNVSNPVKDKSDIVTDSFTSEVQAVVYIGASAGGVVFVILIVIIGVVCRKKRSQRPGGHSKALEMDVCSNSDDSFKGELIENTLYQSADGFDNKGATMYPSISVENKSYIPLSNSTEQLEPDLNNGVEHPSNQTDETKLSNCISKDINEESKSPPIVDDSTKLRHILNPGDEYAAISKSDKNT